jgi:hypothetical protein
MGVKALAYEVTAGMNIVAGIGLSLICLIRQFTHLSSHLAKESFLPKQT